MKLVIITLALSLIFASNVDAGLVVSDGGSTIPTGFTTGLVNTTAPDAAPLTQRFGWNPGAEVGQTFTLDSSITLNSIFIAYNAFADDVGATGDFTITVDAGNNGSDQITETITLAANDFSGASSDGNSGPTYWMEWDLSSNSLVLPAGINSFNISLDSASGATSWLLAPQYQQFGDGYAGGVATPGPGPGAASDYGFAITAIPEPSTIAMVVIGLATFGFRNRRRLVK